MVVTQDCKNVFTEVYEVLNTLEDEEYKKIPSDLISLIEENRNIDYEYEVDDDLDLKEQPMLDETRAMLYNIYRDYLANPEKKKEIIKKQYEERLLEEKKKAKYNSNGMFKYNIEAGEKAEITDENCMSVIEGKKTFWEKIINGIRGLWGKYC